ncbi:hypothetical protein [Brumimicrobium oceani]|uniref:DUF2892 domain-containing protein n=1 Tax=Brumimicrobium oceani TaxID=2100725 RepID=A0A2U2XH55_9FLAO|nr:hypothetical protein [Brumimicrobium oceani]PWH87132.1 hypothetical protein DIT68_02395 [Brumimicrobium oceani]
MKERLLNNWTFIRAIYVIMGSLIIVQTAMSREWIGVLFGGYFAAMGLFAFGCASGNCFGGNCSTDLNKSQDQSIDDVEFEEVQIKN